MTFIMRFLENLDLVSVLERIVLGLCFLRGYLEVTSNLVYFYVICGVDWWGVNRGGG